MRGPGKAPGRASSRDGTGDWPGSVRAAGTDGAAGRPGETARLRAPGGSAVRTASLFSEPAVHGLFGDAEGRSHRIPGEAQRAVEVHRRRDEGFDAVAQFLGETYGRGGGAPVDDEARGRAGAPRPVDVAELSGQGAQGVHLTADPLDVPYQ
ncbi:hypothetical protein ADL21_30660 [Streptomyces albus subsp. albus]|nr:hypothetical protein ADL21_30660 [Streptomyces albus subsp. albus]